MYIQECQRKETEKLSSSECFNNSYLGVPNTLTHLIHNQKYTGKWSTTHRIPPTNLIPRHTTCLQQLALCYYNATMLCPVKCITNKAKNTPVCLCTVYINPPENFYYSWTINLFFTVNKSCVLIPDLSYLQLKFTFYYTMKFEV